MSDSTLRERIISYMQSNAKKVGKEFPTWWFKFHVSGASGTPEIRRELERMERDGLVTSNRRQCNNTLWQLVEGRP